MTRTRQGDLQEIDLEALLWERVPKGPEWNNADVSVLAAGVTQYCRHLTDMATDAQKLGRDSEASKAQRDSEAILHELVGDKDATPPTLGRLFNKPPMVLPGHMKPLEKGLDFYLKNLRAAKGTLRGLGKVDLADEFEEEAAGIEARLLQVFREQAELPLKADKAPDPAGLKDQAEAHAEQTERELAREEQEEGDGGPKLAVQEGGKSRRRKRAAE